jgi:hypothetical protein
MFQRWIRNPDLAHQENLTQICFPSDNIEEKKQQPMAACEETRAKELSELEHAAATAREIALTAELDDDAADKLHNNFKRKQPDQPAQQADLIVDTTPAPIHRPGTPDSTVYSPTSPVHSPYSSTSAPDSPS